jgi:hypothetical protein
MLCALLITQIKKMINQIFFVFNAFHLCNRFIIYVIRDFGLFQKSQERGENR